MKTLSILLLIFLTSCSAEWHLRKAIKLNPKYGDSTKNVQIIIRQDTIRDTISVPSYDFNFTIDSLRNSLDSFIMVYNDSFVVISGKYDSIGKLKFKGKVKERLVPFEVIVHDTIKIETKCPPSVTVNQGYPKWYLWLLISIFVAFLILMIKKNGY